MIFFLSVYQQEFHLHYFPFKYYLDYRQFQDLNSQKIPATRGLWSFKSQYFKG